MALGASLWGTDTPLRRPLTAALSSTNIVLNEHLILSAVLLPVFWRARAEWSKLGPRQWGAITAIGWGGSGLATICFTEAIKIGNPTTAVLLQKTQPLFASLLAALLLAESLGRRFWACLALALVAGYLISVGDRPETLWHPLQALKPERSVAALLALAAAALWGASTVLGRFLLQGLSFQMVTALRILMATPFLLAIAFFICAANALWVGAIGCTRREKLCIGCWWRFALVGIWRLVKNASVAKSRRENDERIHDDPERGTHQRLQDSPPPLLSGRLVEYGACDVFRHADECTVKRPAGSLSAHKRPAAMGTIGRASK